MDVSDPKVIMPLLGNVANQIETEPDHLCLLKIPFSGFHQRNTVTVRSKLARISIRQGQLPMKIVSQCCE
jgi:hypothetical protein